MNQSIIILSLKQRWMFTLIYQIWTWGGFKKKKKKSILKQFQFFCETKKMDVIRFDQKLSFPQKVVCKSKWNSNNNINKKKKTMENNVLDDRCLQLHSIYSVQRIILVYHKINSLCYILRKMSFQPHQVQLTRL